MSVKDNMTVATFGRNIEMHVVLASMFGVMMINSTVTGIPFL
jgi:hypothetical protein